MIDKIIEALIIGGIVTLVISITGWLIKKYITSALNEIQADIKQLRADLKDINNIITNIRLELASDYLKKIDFKDFKQENIEAHTNLRKEIRDIEINITGLKKCSEI
ncbi:MAG: hypothetical protein M0P71_17445 [Melioribacteraceae bacterium]|nr:hypothetical protein [Melioribacteraceae bacterium]